MITFKNHEFNVIKFRTNTNRDVYSVGYDNPIGKIETVYNELYTCSKCNFRMWNLTEDADDILTCDEEIIKGIIE